jgi:redox-sensing transcriptional repressor
MEDIGEAAKERLLQFLSLLENHSFESRHLPITPALIGQLTGWPQEPICRDISSLGSVASGDGSYEPELLQSLIKKALGLDRRRKMCVMGLGRLGSAFLHALPPGLGEFELAAGFDSNVNRVEILNASVPLYPAYKFAEVAGRFRIEIALLCVPPETAQAAAEQCARAGIKGILNFAPVQLKLPPEIAIRNMVLADDLRALAVKMLDA